jgi:hypothetical protein
MRVVKEKDGFGWMDARSDWLLSGCNFARFLAALRERVHSNGCIRT